jgi:hypothetical protein
VVFLCISQQGEFKNNIKTFLKQSMSKTFYNFFKGAIFSLSPFPLDLLSCFLPFLCMRSSKTHYQNISLRSPGSTRFGLFPTRACQVSFVQKIPLKHATKTSQKPVLLSSRRGLPPLPSELPRHGAGARTQMPPPRRGGRLPSP